jgi:hypothetical protein
MAADRLAAADPSQVPNVAVVLAAAAAPEFDAAKRCDKRAWDVLVPLALLLPDPAALDRGYAVPVAFAAEAIAAWPDHASTAAAETGTAQAEGGAGGSCEWRLTGCVTPATALLPRTTVEWHQHRAERDSPPQVTFSLYFLPPHPPPPADSFALLLPCPRCASR